MRRADLLMPTELEWVLGLPSQIYDSQDEPGLAWFSHKADISLTQNFAWAETTAPSC